VLHLTPDHAAKLVAVTLRRVFGAMAHQRHGLPASQLLDQPKREFLPVILDGAASRVNRPVHEQLAAILPQERPPADSSRLDSSEQPLAWTKRGHPDVVPARRKPAAAKPRRENPKSIATPVDGTPDGFGANHDAAAGSRALRKICVHSARCAAVSTPSSSNSSRANSTSASPLAVISPRSRTAGSST